MSGADRPIGRGTTGRGELLAAQKQRYGGIKWGSAFFGWLTATGTALLCTRTSKRDGGAGGRLHPNRGRNWVAWTTSRPGADATVAGRGMLPCGCPKVGSRHATC